LTTLPPVPVLSRALALSVKQPWAELILRRRKHIEVRSWSSRYRGLLWLHTGRVPDAEATHYFRLGELPLGAFVGIIEVIDVVPFDPDRWQKWRTDHMSPGPFRAGLFAWMIANPIRLKRPVPASGQKGLFAISPYVLETNLASLTETDIRCD
jgi:hypothetical protein